MYHPRNRIDVARHILTTISSATTSAAAPAASTRSATTLKRDQVCDLQMRGNWDRPEDYNDKSRVEKRTNLLRPRPAMTITSAGNLPDNSFFLLYLTHFTCDPPLGVLLTLTLKPLHVHTLCIVVCIRYISSSMFIFSLNLMTECPYLSYTKKTKTCFPNFQRRGIYAGFLV